MADFRTKEDVQQEGEDFADDREKTEAHNYIGVYIDLGKGSESRW